MVVTQEKVFIGTSTSLIWNKAGKGMNLLYKLMVFNFVFFKVNFTIIRKQRCALLKISEERVVFF